jgi:adenine-specific DNA-methyltransferase
MDKREFRKNGQHFMAHNLYRYQCLLKNPDEVLKLFASIPFMNGGLFECLDKTFGTRENPEYIRIDGFSDRDDNSLTIPNELFFGAEREVDLSAAYGAARYRNAKVRGLIHTLDRYKFTVAENTPIEEEIALDPELLGKVFENLLAAYNPETGATARKQTGSFYTPREIVHYMVEESLLASLETKLEAAVPNPTSAPKVSPSPGGEGRGEGGLPSTEQRLRHLFAYNDQPHQFTTAEVDALIESIDHLKILDPACGSGAFPMGILHKLVFVLSKLDPGNQRWKARQLAKAAEIPDATVRERVLDDIEQTFGANELDYGRKLYLIENCIYGVDIQPIAVQIAKLRCFISLVVDQKIDPQRDNLGIRSLPNLETRFVAANTLIGLDRPVQQLLRSPDVDVKEAELRRVRERHFLARTPATKAKYREQDANLRTEITELLKNDGWDTATARKLASWDPYDQNASAEFFDTEWMFGETNGFDVVIGNPPYVSALDFARIYGDALREQLNVRCEVATGAYDLFVLFMEQGLKLCKELGHLSFITPNKYLSAKYAVGIRGWLLNPSPAWEKSTLRQLLLKLTNTVLI